MFLYRETQGSKGVEHVICDVIERHCINIVAAAILQLVSNLVVQFQSSLRLFNRKSRYDKCMSRTLFAVVLVTNYL